VCRTDRGAFYRFGQRSAFGAENIVAKVVIYWIRFPSPEAFQVFLNDLQVAKKYRIIGILKNQFYTIYRSLNNINLKEAQICNIFIFLNLVLNK